jgi:hypothetical protein
VQKLETLEREWGEHLHELVIQLENRREVVLRGWFGPHLPSIAAIPAMQEALIAAVLSGRTSAKHLQPA